MIARLRIKGDIFYDVTLAGIVKGGARIYEKKGEEDEGRKKFFFILVCFVSFFLPSSFFMNYFTITLCPVSCNITIASIITTRTAINNPRPSPPILRSSNFVATW